MKSKTPLTFNHQLTFGAARPKRRRLWYFLALLVPLLAVVLTHKFMPRIPPHVTKPAEAPRTAPAPAKVAARQEPADRKVEVVVRRNDTIEGIFKQLRLSAADLRTVLNVPVAGRSFRQLKPGDRITVVHEGAVLQAIDRHISETEVLSFTRSENGFAAERIITLGDAKSPQAREEDQSS